MTEDFTSNNEIEHIVAVAAAAFAINAIQESSFPDKTQIDDIRISMPKPGESSKTMAESQDSEVPVTAVMTSRPRSIKKTPTFAGTKPESDPGRSFKKDPSFSDKNLNRTNGMKPDGSRPMADTPTVKPRSPLPKPEQPAYPSTQTRRQNSARAGTGETIADAWEREELAKINERYGKLKDEILSWENKKKAKAKRRLNKNEQELEQRRLKVISNFHSKIEYIEQIAAGARAQAEEKRRNEEFKVKEKANKIRTTGKIPATCFCF
ncbi:hypothetical protein HS088_TW22G00844 [Tripterygium wilfordii]|uniref:Remorin C-terminal domain-containing protein n=2 Tax=Tripterygium wilfordii TaxID=458696 RepID=A0A7J7BZW0_TRIWF|nr:hypothetical protein HS088_TW22G00844 [Tripterygium wilfordii]